MVSILKRAFEFVFTIQFVLFILFIITNYTDLTNIPYEIDLNGTNYSFTVNLYWLILFVVGVMTIIVLAGISLFGSGINDTSIGVMATLIGILSLYSLMLISFLYYVGGLGSIGLLMEVLSGVVYGLYALSTLIVQNGGETKE